MEDNRAAEIQLNSMKETPAGAGAFLKRDCEPMESLSWSSILVPLYQKDNQYLERLQTKVSEELTHEREAMQSVYSDMMPFETLAVWSGPSK
ncbi:hypothetical protein BTVI_18700 [Pitangus sulphuratus]|nr:hypothetical protein BTVI_18700 [Pitangus sulphuratus]